jgi:murein DD-endopeptidase MepM/ murein hydrolase activator NlpD
MRGRPPFRTPVPLLLALVLRPPARMLAAVLAVALTAAGATGCSIPRWPVAGEMTSPYGVRLRGWTPRLHHGVDIAAPEGTPVVAMQPGRVERAGPWGGYGLAIVIRHNRNVSTLYAHLSRIDVRAGERVRGGQHIGAVGRTGNATGPHLHFEVWRWGRPDDPVPLLGGFPPRRQAPARPAPGSRRRPAARPGPPGRPGPPARTRPPDRPVKPRQLRAAS